MPARATSMPDPSAPSDAAESYGNFDLVKRFRLEYADVVVSKWRSRVTGLSTVHLDYDAPIVKGYFVVGTEIFNDSGCPHTLEHLVFLGSAQYPYKGVLDNLANRAFSAGTNAWTDTDHTAYTIATAGEQGFLQLLPIYVDHILNPTLTHAGFVTEVHHIDSKGQNSGVVYSEMQGRQNTSGDLMALAAQHLVYPKSSAYRSETAGLMEALRILTVQQIRDYHRAYYVPHNLCLIVAGKLSTTSLLDILQNQVEPSIIEKGKAHGPRPAGWKRPFVETPSAETPVIAPKSETIEFPEKDESVGEMTISWIGPRPDEFVLRKAIDIIGSYLTDSAVAPLTKEYVEIPSPLCTYIYFAEDTRATFSDLTVYFGSVPTEYLDTLDEKFKDSLRRIVQEGIDMERMETVLKRDKLKFISALESSRGDIFSGTVIQDFLYGAQNGDQLSPSLEHMQWYDELSSWTNQQWTSLLEKWYINAPSVVIRGKPSATLAESLETNEKKRIAKQVEDLGEQGLAELGRELEEAKQENEKPIPPEILRGFPVPDVKSISWIPVQSAKNDPESNIETTPQSNKLEEHISKDGSPLPFFVQFDHVQSDFVGVHAFLSLADLPDNLRPYVTVYLTAFFGLPVVRSDGTRLTHEEVVKQLDKTTVAYDTALGIDSYFTELYRISLKAEVSQYEAAVSWLYDLMYSSEFTEDRLEVAIAKVQQSLPELKRDGNTVVGSVSGGLLFAPSSTVQATSITTSMEFIPQVAKELKNDPQGVIRKMNEIRDYITSPSSLRFSIVGNILDLPNPRSVWSKYFEDVPKHSIQPVKWTHETLSPLGRNPVKKGVVVALPTIESSFAVHSTKTIVGFNHADAPALRVACEVLDGTESFLWKYIRGSGLAYGASMSLDLETGILAFTLYRSPNSYQAFQEAAKVVKGLCDGSIVLDDTIVDAAKSSIVYSLARNVSSPGRAAVVSFTNQALKGVPQDFGRELLKKYQDVTIPDVIASLRKHVLPLFDPLSSIAVVVSAPSKADEIARGLEGVGFTVEQRTLDVPEDELGSESGSEAESETSSVR